MAREIEEEDDDDEDERQGVALLDHVDSNCWDSWQCWWVRLGCST